MRTGGATKIFCSAYMITLFFPVLVTLFKQSFQTLGDEFLKTEGGFWKERTNFQKPLLVFTYLSRFGRCTKEYFQPIFPDFAILVFSLLITSFKCSFRKTGDKFLKTKRGFCWQHTHLQKSLLVF